MPLLHHFLFHVLPMLGMVAVFAGIAKSAGTGHADDEEKKHECAEDLKFSAHAVKVEKMWQCGNVAM